MSPTARDLALVIFSTLITLVLAAVAWAIATDPYGPRVMLGFLAIWFFLVLLVAIFSAGLNAVLRGK